MRWPNSCTLTVPMKTKFVMIIMKTKCFRKWIKGDSGSGIGMMFCCIWSWRNFRKGIRKAKKRAAETRARIEARFCHRITKR